MKKTLAILLTLVMLFATAVAVITVSAEVEPNEDWDADEDGVYRIRTAADLLAFSSYAEIYSNYKDKTVELANDIDMNGVEWYQVMVFCGTLDGKNHAIKNLSMATEGFIRRLTDGAVIKNIRFENVNQATNATTKNSGIIVLSVTGSVLFENVYVQGSITSTTEVNYTGGFISFINAGGDNTNTATFNNCVSDVKVKGGFAGGFIGLTSVNSKAVFNDCVFLGDLSETAKYSSNFTGLCVGGAELTRCVSLGKSSKNADSGALVYVEHITNQVAQTKIADIIISDCYAAVGEGQCAIGTNAKRSTCYRLEINYGGNKKLDITASAEDTLNAHTTDIEAAMQFIAKGDTVNVTKDNFAEKCPALAKDNKWVVMGDETVAYADGKTAVKLMSATSKALLETAEAPAEGTGDSGNTDDGENNENGNNTDNGGNGANTTAPSDTTPETKPETKADDTTADTEEEKKSGCGSVIGGSVIAVAAVMGCAVAFAGKKKED